MNAGATRDQLAAIEAGNALANEGNDSLAQLVATSRTQTAALEAMLATMRGGGSFAPNLSLLSR